MSDDDRKELEQADERAAQSEGVMPDPQPPDYDPHPLEGGQTEAVDDAQEEPEKGDPV